MHKKEEHIKKLQEGLSSAFIIENGNTMVLRVLKYDQTWRKIISEKRKKAEE